MKKASLQTLSIIAALFVAGCTTAPEADPAYVSVTQYQDYNCKQLRAEMQRVSKKIEVSMQTEATTQVLNAAVTAFAISRGYGVSARDNVEMRRLKNQYDVLEQTSIQKQCGL